MNHLIIFLRQRMKPSSIKNAIEEDGKGGEGEWGLKECYSSCL